MTKKKRASLSGSPVLCLLIVSQPEALPSSQHAQLLTVSSLARSLPSGNQSIGTNDTGATFMRGQAAELRALRESSTISVNTSGL